MPGTSLIALDGVLRGHSGQPLAAGLQLYAALGAVSRLVLLADTDDTESDTRWLHTEGLREHVEVIGPAQVAVRGEPVRERQLTYARGRGMILDLLLDSSPANIAAAVRLGIPSLLFVEPRYARPEFRMDTPRGAREWGALVGELDLQDALADADERR